MDGILNVNKPAGMTSHDVVSLVRRLSRQQRVGHAGTLDPLAKGVLVVCLGKATKVVEFLINDRKAYLANITLGVTTDTYDSEGRIMRESPVDCTTEQIAMMLDGFRGNILQVPPVYSAIKRGGQPLYKMARAGREVVAEARPVTIHELEIRDFQSPLLTLFIRCSKGTYVRSIAHDLGERLGCGAHLSGLVRTESGYFGIDGAVTIECLTEAFARGAGDELLFALDEALVDYDAVIVGAERVSAIRNGADWPAGVGLRERIVGDHGPVRVYSVEGEIVAMARFDGYYGRWRPSKVI